MDEEYCFEDNNIHSEELVEGSIHSDEVFEDDLEISVDLKVESDGTPILSMEKDDVVPLSDNEIEDVSNSKGVIEEGQLSVSNNDNMIRWSGAYGWLHIISLMIGAAWVIFSGLFRFLFGEDKIYIYRAILCYIALVNESMLVGFQAGKNGWKFVSQNHFPFHICGFLVYAYPFHFYIFNHHWFAEYLFLWAVLGAGSAILTPAKNYVESVNFRFISFFIAHFFIVSCAVFSVCGLGLVLTEWCWLRFFIFANIQAFITIIVNKLLGANYMFLLEAPPTSNPLMKGEFPFHILKLEPLVIIFSLLVYLPFKFTNQ
eukprot:TRINITY_DN11922_c0_g1_i1.p1 TRINITY_DN11922_c0_g1~~TRINITY_DN11922_c0_g1_i1.p1  ORF type:complete len:315 (-),score=75.05 TRINITY_DN11922_c0_g1_i1:36-980(-)